MQGAISSLPRCSDLADLIPCSHFITIHSYGILCASGSCRRPTPEFSLHSLFCLLLLLSFSVSVFSSRSLYLCLARLLDTNISYIFREAHPTKWAQIEPQCTSHMQYPLCTPRSTLTVTEHFNQFSFSTTIVTMLSSCLWDILRFMTVVSLQYNSIHRTYEPPVGALRSCYACIYHGTCSAGYILATRFKD